MSLKARPELRELVVPRRRHLLVEVARRDRAGPLGERAERAGERAHQ